MKKSLLIMLGLFCAATLAVQAQDNKPKRSEEQKAFRKQILDKYDTNKDGKLDKDERAKISQEDRDKMAKLGAGGRKKGAASPDAPGAPTAPDKK
jgi:hypothetical protein